MSTAERFRLLEPLEFHKAHLEKGLRSDGRSLGETRATSLQLGVVSNAQGSAMVKIGSTTVMATIRAEVGEPNLLKSPRQGSFNLTINSNSPTLPEIDTDFLHQIEVILGEMVMSETFFPLDSLCMKEGVYVWSLSANLLCLDADAALFDTCLLGLVAALNDVRLPSVTFPAETEFTNQLSVLKEGPPELVVDPGSEELSLLDSGLLSLAVEAETMAALHHFSFGAGWDASLLSPSLLAKAQALAQRRHTQIQGLIKEAMLQKS